MRIFFSISKNEDMIYFYFNIFTNFFNQYECHASHNFHKFSKLWFWKFINIWWILVPICLGNRKQDVWAASSFTSSLSIVSEFSLLMSIINTFILWLSIEYIDFHHFSSNTNTVLHKLYYVFFSRKNGLFLKSFSSCFICITHGIYQT